ncbi:MAG: zinc ribbon domain-containing protein [Dehalococcoidia bacterium]|nr:zinc ribbon domain-containing protein [Dehalococcoidia bacterium]
MFCSNCGELIVEEANFCKKCGFNTKGAESQSRKLTIERPPQFSTRNVSYNILVDGIRVDMIVDNDLKTFGMSDGEHTVKLTVKPGIGSLMESNEISIGKNDQDVSIRVKMKSGVFKNSLILERRDSI